MLLLECSQVMNINRLLILLHEGILIIVDQIASTMCVWQLLESNHAIWIAILRNQEASSGATLFDVVPILLCVA